MAFIEGTDLQVATTRCHQARKLSMSLQKILSQTYSNTPQQYRFFHHRHSNSYHQQFYSTLTISRCNICRIGSIVQFDEANLSINSLNNIILVNGGIAINNHHISPEWHSETTRWLMHKRDHWSSFHLTDIRSAEYHFCPRKWPWWSFQLVLFDEIELMFLHLASCSLRRS